MAFTTYLRNKLLDHVLKTASYTVPTNVYVGLSTTATAADGSKTEPSGNNYARIAHNVWDVASGGASENTGVITFPVPSGSWGTVTHVFLMDALTGGNMLMHGPLSASQAIGTGATVSFADGAIDAAMIDGV